MIIKVKNKKDKVHEENNVFLTKQKINTINVYNFIYVFEIIV